MGLFDFLKKSGSTDETRSPGSTGNPGQTSDFDKLVQRTQQEKSRESLDALWGAVYAMENWYMIAAGEPPNVGPFIGVMEDKPFVFAFTEPEKAAESAKSHGLVDKNGDPHLLAIPVAGFARTVDTYIEKGVFGILFNDGENAFYTPLTDIKSMFHFHRQGT
jgi:hypothetical protein